MGRKKERTTLTLPPGLKKKVKEKLEYSSLTMSDLVEEKFRNFLDEDVREEVLKDDMSEYKCECGAFFTEAAKDKADGCPGCGDDSRFEKAS